MGKAEYLISSCRVPFEQAGSLFQRIAQSNIGLYA